MPNVISHAELARIMLAKSSHKNLPSETEVPYVSKKHYQDEYKGGGKKNRVARRSKLIVSNFSKNLKDKIKNLI